MPETPSNSPCPCCSEKSFGECCQPILKGRERAETAEDLLRARYTAFVVGEVDFIVSSHHSKTKAEVNRDEIAKWSKDSEWEGLKILQKEAGTASDSTGTLIFHAKYKQEGKTQDHYEKSFFEKEQGEWNFLDAQGIQTGPYVRTEPKLGRNDPCHCGSGKKFKRCHGQTE